MSKRERVGGVIAGMAMRQKIGTIVRSFPPVVMLTDREREKVTDAYRRRMKAIKRERANGHDHAAPEPQEATNGALATGAQEPITATPRRSWADEVRDLRAFAEKIAADKSLPAELRIEAYDLLNQTAE